MELEAAIVSSVQSAIHESITKHLSSYNSPIVPIVGKAVEAHAPIIKALMSEVFVGIEKDPNFRAEFVAAIRQKVARELISKMSGEVEKQVNALKADPSTRARITLAIESVVGQSK